MRVSGPCRSIGLTIRRTCQLLSQPELTAFLYANELLGERSNGMNEVD